jgi:type I restriction-modification system DNA methylase subunit
MLDSYAPSAAVTFLLRRMDVNTPAAAAEEMYSLMTGFMTVYVCFIQVVLNKDFDEFMNLFHYRDSLLTKENQLFYALNNTCILIELHKQLDTIDSSFILSNMDAIFSKFYTMYFLETSAQKHQKDHGQFYTPQSVIQFMWDKCATTFSLVQYLQHRAHMPRVFDPCLGIGSFLCEFLTRFTKACRFTVWNDPNQLIELLTSHIPDHIWGVEIDPFAYQLCKINMMVHMFPIYQRLKQLGVSLSAGAIHRLRLFCNDSLKLQVNTNPFRQADDDVDRFEQDCLDLLRDASKLKFDFIVTNPPYMIRKTGFIAQPDPTIYDEAKLGGRGTQAYLYFMWIALQRCDDIHGQVCLITPSQWTVLEFAQHLRYTTTNQFLYI